MVVANPFVDPEQCPALYRDPGRLARRTNALHRAKAAGRPVVQVISDLASEYLERRLPRVVADVGCGRGSSTRALAEALRPDRVVGIDASADMLAEARVRAGDSAERVGWARADFHHLPLEDASCDLVVAAFCLYHSPEPPEAIAELARCLAPSGVAVFVTKSIDSYRELDELVAAAGLDPDACRRPSLYESAHSGNLASLTAGCLHVRHVEHEEHRFDFVDLGHVADYLATSPKYAISGAIHGDPKKLASALRGRLPDGSVSTTSRVTYVVSVRRGGAT